MTPLLLALIAFAALLGIAGCARARAPGWPWWALAQAAAAIVLGVLLTRDPVPPPAEDLVVLTAGAGDTAPVPVRGQAVVALPGAKVPAGAQAVPDLAGALRRHPTTTRLQVHGGGLSERDRATAAGLRVAFEPGPAPVGIVALEYPSTIVAGSTLRVRGRVGGVAPARIELRDPAQRAVDQQEVDADGRFELGATARIDGRAGHTLVLFDDQDRIVEETIVPLLVVSGDAPRVMVLAGAPDPELRALRRWSVDAGFDLASRIALAPGLALRRGETALDGDALARIDLLVVDPRSWTALPQGERAAVVAAVRDGMGLLLRINGPLPDAVRSDWRELGFAIAPAELAEGVALAAPPRAAAWPELTRRPIEVQAADSLPMLAAADGAVLARWRPFARGRVGAIWLTDTYKLAQAVSATAHGELWSDIVHTLARARGPQPLATPRESRIDQRAILCGVAPGSQVIAPDGSATALIVQAGDPRACAAYWPAAAGWHRLQSGGRSADFPVRSATEAPALEAMERRDATTTLAQGSAAIEAPAPPRSLPAWTLFLLWLALTATIWWRERRPGGRDPA